MRVICPHCRTIYQLPGADPDAVLVCHRCGTEFGLGEAPEGAEAISPVELKDSLTPDMFAQARTDTESDEFASPEVLADASAEPPIPESVEELPEETSEPPSSNEPAEDVPEETADSPAPLIIPARETWNSDAPSAEPQPLDRAEESTETEQEHEDSGQDIEASDLPEGPPPRARARIMPWLFAVVVLIGGTGFWINHEAWLDDPWFRSVLINAGIGMDIRDKDWRVSPDSVQAVWIERKGADTALVITGEVANRLQTDLPPPLIHVALFARDNPDEVIAERDMIITRPPLMQAIRRAPFIAPPRDNAPVPALEKRGFVLVLEDLPQNAGNFSLSAKAR